MFFLTEPIFEGHAETTVDYVSADDDINTI